MRCYHMRVETYSSKNFEKFQEFQITKNRFEDCSKIFRFPKFENWLEHIYMCSDGYVNVYYL
jgi:hypothetical protein